MYIWVHIYVSKNFSPSVILLGINPKPSHFTATETNIVMDHITMFYDMMVVIRDSNEAEVFLLPGDFVAMVTL